MKKLVVYALMGLASLASVQAHAQSVRGSVDFNVEITLNSACQLTANGDGALEYTSFAAANTATATAASISIQCTDDLPFTATLDGDTSTATNAYNFTDSTLNLNYTLTLASSTTTLSGTGTSVGTGSAETFTVTPSINGVQGGTCNGATCSNTAVHTLTLSY